MKRMCKRVTAFTLVLIMLFTTGCSSGFYADELSPVNNNVSVSDNNIEVGTENEDSSDNPIIEDTEDTSEVRVTITPTNTAEDELTDSTEDEWNIDSNEDENVLEDKESGYDQNGQYHVDPDDWSTKEIWKRLYMPSGNVSDLDNLPQEWWDNLSKDDDFYIFSLKLMEYPDRDSRVYTDQSVSECLDIIRNGYGIDILFGETMYEGITEEHLVALQDAGYEMIDLTNVILVMR